MDRKSTVPSEILQEQIVRPLKRRWFIIFVYSYYATLSCFQWVEYSIISNLVTKYYDVPSTAVDWTAVMFMVVWPIFVFPSSFLIDKLGLRFAALAGCLLTAAGTAIKLFSLGQDKFAVVLLGQAVVSLSQVFILSLPPKIAVTWFKANEVSTVCSLGVFGMQLGCALGFLVPPMVVKNHENLDNIRQSLKILCWALSLATIPGALAVLIYFPGRPPYAPSSAQVIERRNVQNVNIATFLESLFKLLKNGPFLIHATGYSLCYGIFSAFGTLLNQFVLFYFPGSEEDVGSMGLLMITVGMVGCGLVGFLLDKSHKYKETAVFTYVLSTISVVVLLCALELKSKYWVYASIALFGFFLNSYIPAGIEFASELTYPSNESTTVGVMTAGSQVLGTLLTFALGRMAAEFGASWALVAQIATLGLGTVLTIFVPNRLLRLEVYEAAKTVPVAVLEGLLVKEGSGNV